MGRLDRSRRGNCYSKSRSLVRLAAREAKLIIKAVASGSIRVARETEAAAKARKTKYDAALKKNSKTPQDLCAN